MEFIAWKSLHKTTFVDGYSASKIVSDEISFSFLNLSYFRRDVFLRKNRTIPIRLKAKIMTQIASQKYLQASGRGNIVVNMAATIATRPITVVKHNLANA